MASVGVCTRPAVVLLKAAALRVEGGQGAGGIDADQPVRFAARDRGVGQRLHFLRRCADAAKAVRMASGVIDCSQRRWIGCFAPVALTMLRKISSPSRPASQALMSRATSLRLISRRARASRFGVLLDRREGELRREERQLLHRPLAAPDLVLLRDGELEQMADGRRDDVVVVLEVIAVLFHPERLGEIGGDAGFFGDDESFGHGKVGWRVDGKSSSTNCWPGSCFTSRFISRASNVDDTLGIGKPDFATIASSGVSRPRSTASRTRLFVGGERWR